MKNSKAVMKTIQVRLATMSAHVLKTRSMHSYTFVWKAKHMTILIF